MTTNQTIDGVPREQMISFPRELDDEMAEILAEKARVCGAGAFDIWELLCARFGTETASQPQREPVAWMQPNQGGMCISNEVKQHSIKLGGAPASAVAGYSIPLHAEQPAQVAVALPERSNQDYAIEHAEYMALSADDVLAKFQAYGLALLACDEGGDDGEGELLENIDSARGDLQESLVDMRSMVYEFRKRSAKSR